MHRHSNLHFRCTLYPPTVLSSFLFRSHHTIMSFCLYFEETRNDKINVSTRGGGTTMYLSGCTDTATYTFVVHSRSTFIHHDATASCVLIVASQSVACKIQFFLVVVVAFLQPGKSYPSLSSSPIPTLLGQSEVGLPDRTVAPPPSTRDSPVHRNLGSYACLPCHHQYHGD